MLRAINPATAKPLWQVPTLSTEALLASVQAAQVAQTQWAHKSFSERAEWLQAVAHELRARKHTLAELMAAEMGKPLQEGLAEVEKSAWCAEHYAANAGDYLQAEPLASDASESYVCYQPLGTVLGILPWNAPLWLAFRFLAPALMAGNTCLMKHDPHVPKCAEAIAELFDAVQAPQGIVVNLPLTTEQVAHAIGHPAVAAVSFTGSSAAGAKVASLAASLLKPSVLELGGSDPLLVLADADLDRAADVAVLSRIINAGQSCIAAKRVIVDRGVYKEFIELLAARLGQLKVGDPCAEGTAIGPLARDDLRANLDRQVQETVAAGAKCILGGETPTGPGFFYPVTLLVDVTPAMCAAREETFGPVMVVMEADDAEHALALANNTDYGLGAGVWTADPALAQRFVEQLQVGQVAVNGIVKTDPRLPSGGIKRSGFGRELGPHGIREFVNAKQVWKK